MPPKLCEIGEHVLGLRGQPIRTLPANQIPVLVGISSRVYQLDVINMNAGVIVASATPNKNRTVMRPPKLVHAAVRATTAPQNRVLAVKYFPVGRRAMSKVVGYDHPK